MRLPTLKQLERSLSAIVLLAILLSMTAGCRSTRVSSEYNASVGQQLLDLQKAHEQGVISDREYQKLKRKIVSKND